MAARPHPRGRVGRAAMEGPEPRGTVSRRQDPPVPIWGGNPPEHKVMPPR